MIIQLLIELIPLFKIVLIGTFSTIVIKSVRKFLKTMETGEYTISISFLKVGK